MSVLGIIAEYNPLHNGHIYHMRRSAELLGTSSTVCMMSGDFVQRGEPALISKWCRAAAAVSEGADLVLELPVIFSTSSAEKFAAGAVKLLDSLGIIDYLSFGSENGNLTELERAASYISDENDEFKAALRSGMRSGYSYPKAYQKAVLDVDADSALSLDGPNNVLAIEYLKAIRRLKSRMIPYTILREGSDYRSEVTQGRFSSAASLRRIAYSGNDISAYVPESMNNLLVSGVYRQIDDFSDILLYLLRTADFDIITKTRYMNDGVGEILIRNASISKTLSELIGISCNKRHTRSRISRALASLLLGITAEMNSAVLSSVSYVRVLAFNSNGANLLRRIKTEGKAIVINKSAGYRKILVETSATLFRLDLMASDIYSSAGGRRYIEDIKHSPVILL